MNRSKRFVHFSAACLLLGLASSSAADTTVWNFTGGNFTADAGGGVMSFFNNDATFGSFGSGSIGGSSTDVLNFVAASPTQGLQVTHNVAPNGGGAFVNQYTLMMDVMFPAVGVWAGLYQTNTTNTNDGDWFVNPDNGIGIGGDYDGVVVAGQWHRLGLVINPSDTGASYRKYIDGVEVGFQGSADGTDGRFSLDPFFLLLTDEGSDGVGNETNSGVLSSVLFADRPFLPAEMSARGAPTAGGIPGSVTLPVLELVFDRDSGNIAMQNNTGFAQDIKGYSILSGDGALLEENAIFFADTDSDWVQFTAPGATGDISEGHLTTDSIADGASISLGNAWLKYYSETADISFEYIDGDGRIVEGAVSFSGNDGSPFPYGDLDRNGDINGQDWIRYVAGLGADLSALTVAQAYLQGDMTGNLLNNHDDFLAFRNAYDAANGAGAFDAMLGGVPEPSSVLLWALCGVFAIGATRIRRIPSSAAAVAMITLLAVGTAQAQLPEPAGLWEFDNPSNLTAATFGDGLVLTGNSGAGSHSAVAGIGAGDGAVSIGIGSYYQAFHGIAANGGPGAQFVNEFTLVFDVLYPEASAGQWRSFFNTNNTNTNDGDYFIHPSDESWGVGDLGYTDNPGTGEFFSSANTWYRAVMTVNLDDDPNLAFFNLYINGVLTGTHNAGGLDSRLSLYSSADPLPIIVLAGDENGEDAEMHYSNIGIWDRPLTPLEITALGGPSADGIDLDAPVAGVKLEVNTTTGKITLMNGSGIDMPEGINFYEIRSDSGALNTNSWNSLDEQNFGAIGGDIGESWDAGGGSDDNLLTEAFLLGSSLFENNDSVTLGNAFDPSVFGQDVDGDLEFFFGMADSDLFIEGTVTYVTGGFEADFDRDGDVDGNDFLLWQAGFPTTSGATKMDGDYDNDGDVDGNDFLGWQAQFPSPGSGAGSAAVPEPGTFGLAGLLLAGLVLGSIRRQKEGSAMDRAKGLLLSAVVVVAAMTSTAIGDTTNDRLYEMGENSSEGGSVGGDVSETYDSAGTFPGFGGNVQNLISVFQHEPTYVDVSSTGLDRPGAASGALGIEFNGANMEYLSGDWLGWPEESAASFGGEVFGPEDYSGIVNRGFQLWVRPAASGGTRGASRQDIVMDTFQHGVGISAGGTWFMQYDDEQFDSGVVAAVDTWTHVMVVRPSGAAGGSRMYINGVAESVAPGGYDGGDNALLVLGANTGDNIDTFPGESNHFSGVVDELSMFVMGTSTELQIDYGTFNAGEDNAFIASAAEGFDPADVNLDTVVNMADVTDFVAAWRSENLVDDLLVGDLNSRATGDLNYNGTVDLADWVILNAANPSMGAAAMRAIRGVPEPSTIVLLALAVAGLVLRRRR